MTDRTTVVGLGEVLWDVFPDGPRFGGAPANFACSAAELAGDEFDVLMVGAVGPDELGRRAARSLQEHGVDTRHVAVVERPTGQVLVKLDSRGQSTFEIATDTAWDNIPWSNELAQLAGRTGAVCFGTLAQRSEISRGTIQQFLRATPAECLRILDVNLRAPFWSEAIVLQSLELANVLKLNDEELAVLGEMLSWSGGTDHDLLQHLINRFKLRLVALTRGADGAIIVSDSGEQSNLPGQPVDVVDTVGAGDSYTAALALGLLSGLALEKINAWATRVAAFVCSQAGGTPKFPAALREA